jgi:prepilin-type N-terminal cleavage/methylation domain-containing protein
MKMKLVNNCRNWKGFTLVELLVVMAILGVLVTLVAGGFRTAQMRGRDAQRKSDLKELANSLELLYSDYNEYPGEISGRMAACPYVLGAGTACVWGSSEMTDGKTVYFKTVPADPNSSSFYLYRVPDTANQKFQLFARLENTQDQDIITTAYSCGTELCNFAITASNTNALE